MRVLIFGDSITQGQWDSEGGWAQRLIIANTHEILATNPEDYTVIFNLGISGDTTEGVLKRLANECEARKWEGEEFTIVFAIGINDTKVIQGVPLSSPGKYLNELQALYDIALRYAKKVLFVGLTPIENDNPEVNEQFSNDRIWQFEQVLRAFVAEKSVPFVPVFEEFQKVGGGLLSDGLHPNESGHELIYKTVQPKLNELMHG